MSSIYTQMLLVLASRYPKHVWYFVTFCSSQGSGGGRLLRAPNRRSISLASSVPVAPTEDAGVVSLDPFAANESPAIELPSSVLSNSALVAGNVSLRVVFCDTFAVPR